jgi:hypothetical protein
MASTAASLIASGAEKSGKPWARLIASCSAASLDISRITDSVNWRALAETRDEERLCAPELELELEELPAGEVLDESDIERIPGS